MADTEDTPPKGGVIARDEIEQHFVPIAQIMTGIEIMLDAHDDLQDERARSDCASAVRFLVEQLKQRQHALYEELYHRHYADLERQEVAKGRKKPTLSTVKKEETDDKA